MSNIKTYRISLKLGQYRDNNYVYYTLVIIPRVYKCELEKIDVLRLIGLTDGKNNYIHFNNSYYRISISTNEVSIIDYISKGKFYINKDIIDLESMEQLCFEATVSSITSLCEYLSTQKVEINFDEEIERIVLTKSISSNFI